MPIRLPPSLDRARHTVDEEVAWARSLTEAQRLDAVWAASRAAVALLEMRPDRERVLALRDELPESTKVALRRLHAEFLRQQAEEADGG